MSTFPGTLDSFTTKTDNVDTILAAHMNDAQAAIVAIETELGTDPAGTVTNVKTRLAQSLDGAGNLVFNDSTVLTIASGAVTATQNFHRLATEGSASTDTLVTINGGTDGMFLIVRPSVSGSTITFDHGAGNIYCVGAADFEITDPNGFAILIYDGNLSFWLATRGSTGTDVSGGGAANRIAYWATTTALTSDADLTFDGTTFGVGTETTGTTDVAEVLLLKKATDQAAADGFGLSVGFEVEDDAGNSQDAADIQVDWVTAATATRVAEMVITVDDSAGAVEMIRMKANTDGIVVNEGSADMDFRVETNNNTHGLFIDGTNDRVGINDDTPDAKLDVRQSSTSAAVPVLILEQADVDDSFIDFLGTSAADQTKSISTVNGDGAVTGPKNFSSTAGWDYVGMIKIEINGSPFWMPYYTPDLS